MSDAIENRLYLDKNESSLDAPVQFRKDVANIASNLDMRRYPEDYCQSLREKLAKHHGMDMENVVVGNGSDQVISYFIDLWRHSTFALSTPTFGMYKFFLDLREYEYQTVPLTNDFNLNLKELKSIENAVYIVCSPNNPTGNDMARSDVIELLDSGSPVMIDEAYVDFSEQSFVGLLRDYDNLTILRTFSKAFGLAGLRVGYALTSSKIATGVLKSLPPFSMNTFQIEVAKRMLDFTEHVRRNAEIVKKERERVLGILGNYAFKSSSNFYLLDLDIHSFFYRNGVSVRKLSGDLSRMVRVTVGKVEENDRVLELVNEFVHSI